MKWLKRILCKHRYGDTKAERYTYGEVKYWYKNCNKCGHVETWGA